MTDDTRDEFEAEPVEEPVEEPVDEPVDEPVPDDDDQAEAIGEALAELSLDEQLEATRTERDENHQKWQRSLADLENFRRRAHREMDEARTFQALPLARDLMPGLDNLQRAIQAAESTRGPRRPGRWSPDGGRADCWSVGPAWRGTDHLHR